MGEDTGRLGIKALLKDGSVTKESVVSVSLALLSPQLRVGDSVVYLVDGTGEVVLVLAAPPAAVREFCVVEEDVEAEHDLPSMASLSLHPSQHQSVQQGAKPAANPAPRPRPGASRQVCKFFSQGKCRYGMECPFLHEHVPSTGKSSARNSSHPPNNSRAKGPW